MRSQLQNLLLLFAFLSPALAFGAVELEGRWVYAGIACESLKPEVTNVDPEDFWEFRGSNFRYQKTSPPAYTLIPADCRVGNRGSFEVIENTDGTFGLQFPRLMEQTCGAVSGTKPHEQYYELYSDIGQTEIKFRMSTLSGQPALVSETFWGPESGCLDGIQRRYYVQPGGF